jgi:hypothetical protein
MALNPGMRFGPLVIADPIGAGGMGEVYRATDSELKRVDIETDDVRTVALASEELITPGYSTVSSFTAISAAPSPSAATTLRRTVRVSS